ncbi:MAG: DUF4340 domain-containing protein [Clostridia bacterium]|nr:DUF4340 domain-containing protein [Clostridia bacterium]
MRTYRNALILLVVFALVLGGYFAYEKFGKKSDDATKTADETETQALFKIEAEKIKGITIDHKGQKFVIDRKDKELVLTSPEGSNIDKEKIIGLGVTAADMRYTKVVAKGDADLSQFGLTAPQAVVTLAMEDGSSKVIQIGDESPSKESRFVKLADGDSVYAVVASSAESFLLDLSGLKQKTIFNFKPEDVNYLGVQKDGKYSFEVKKGTTWDILKPMETLGDESKVVPIIQSAVGMNIKEYVNGSKLNPADYGLDNPAYVLELGAKDAKNIKLLLGKEKVRGQEIYAKVDGNDDIFVVDEKGFDFGDKTIADIMDAFVYIVNIADVSSIKVEADGMNSIANIKADGENKEQDEFVIDGRPTKDVESEGNTGDGMFRVYYQKLIGLTFDKVEFGANPTGKPDVTITYSLEKAPGTVKIELVRKDDNTYYALKDGKYKNITVAKNQVDQMKDSYKKLIDLLDKAKK